MENNDYIIKLKDGGVVDVTSYRDYKSGYLTCDYGAEYMFLMLTSINIQIKTVSHILSLENTIKLFAKDFSNMTEIEFSEYLKKTVKEISDNEVEYTVIERDYRII